MKKGAQEKEKEEKTLKKCNATYVATIDIAEECESSLKISV